MGYNLLEYEINGKIMRAKIYLLPYDIKLVISDLDGTITKYFYDFSQ